MPIPTPYQLPELHTYPNQTHIEQMRIEQYLINCIKLDGYHNIDILGGQKYIGLAKVLKITFTKDELLIEFRMINDEVLELPITCFKSIAMPSSV